MNRIRAMTLTPKTLKLLLVGLLLAISVLLVFTVLQENVKYSKTHLLPIELADIGAVKRIRLNKFLAGDSVIDVIKKCENETNLVHGFYTKNLNAQNVLNHRELLLNIPLDKEFGSHLVPLAISVLSTTGPVFELGTGLYSTTMLHNISKMQSKQLLSTDTDATWLVKYIDLATESHQFRFVPVYSDNIGCFNRDHSCKVDGTKWDAVGNQPWSVVFVDHRPGERRKIDIVRFRCMSEIVVVHDVEEPSYQYSSVLGKFRSRYEFKTWKGNPLKAHTALLSNYFNLTVLDDFLHMLNS